MGATTATVGSQPQTVFSKVVVGVDSSEEAREALRQAAVLTDAPLTILAAYDVAPSLVGGTGAGVPAYLDEDFQRKGAESALQRAVEDVTVPGAAGKIVRGRSSDELIREVERERATLVAVGAHGVGRVRGIVIGSTTTELVHKAPCSVLVARKRGEDFPRKIVVGIDGSPESAAAYAAARLLAERFTAELWPVVAHGGKPVDRALVEQFAGTDCVDSPDEPVEALVAAAASADLLVVGNRGVHGLKALGSVSERVAHRAPSSVLIVREPDWQRISEELT